MHLKHLALAALMASVMTAATQAQAAILTFTDRALWSTAAGGATGGEDFNGFVTDTSFRLSPVALSSGMSIGALTPDGFSNVNLIDVPPLSFGESDVNGTAHALMWGGLAGNATTPFIQFSTAIKAAGADFKNINDDIARTELQLFSGAALIATLTPDIADFDAVRFFGFVADAGETITEIRFTRLADDIYGIDNIEIAAAGVSDVPAPASLLLLGASLIGLTTLRRQRHT